MDKEVGGRTGILSAAFSLQRIKYATAIYLRNLFKSVAYEEISSTISIKASGINIIF